jgi:hypothetical protein
MILGLLLDGSPAAAGRTHRAADLAPGILSAGWVEIVVAGAASPVVACAQIDRALATALDAAGAGVVQVDEVGETAKVTAFLDGSLIAEGPIVVRRMAPSLLEAVRPVRDDAAALPAEVLLAADRHGPAAARLVTQLLSLSRHDVACSAWTDGEGSLAVFRVPNPPYYVLLRALEEPGEGVRAYAPFADTLWVEWGYRHPLARFAREAVPAGRIALVDRAGQWRLFPRDFAEQNIFDVTAARLDARRTTMTSEPGTMRFEIPLGTAPGGEGASDAWLLGPDDLLGLEAFVRDATPEEIGAFTVARLGAVGRRGAIYLLEERRRTGSHSVGSKLDDLLGCPGFYRWPTTENLFVRVGRKLTPPMRRTELAKVLSLDECYAVLVDDDRDGPLVYAVRDPAPSPLSAWLEYCATDRRLELDRLLETSVFELPEVRVAKPPEAPRAEEAPLPPPRRPRQPARPQPVPPRPEETPKAPQERTAVDEAVLARIQGLEKAVSAGGCDDVATWRELAELKEQVKRFDEAAVAWEAAIFHAGKADVEATTALSRVRAAIHGEVSDEKLLDWVTEQAMNQGAAQMVGARALAMMTQKEALLELVGARIVQLFLTGNAECSRRLAWIVVRAHYTRANDALGLTRAKQSALGHLNARGLDETYDVPAFVRMQLALDSPDAASRDQAEQALAIEQLWEASLPTLQELDADSAYRRALFACGFARVGLQSRAAQLARHVESELPAFEEKTDPTSVLLRLYLARLAAEGSGTVDPESWAKQTERLLPDAVREQRRRGLVDWLRKRSPWLTPGGAPRAPANVSARLLDVAERIAGQPKDASSLLGAVVQGQRVFDYEIVAVMDRALRGVVATGDEEAAAYVLEACMRHLPAITIAGHRATAIGACLGAAATCSATHAVESLVGALLETSRGEHRAGLYDLVGALEPGLAALRRTGESAIARSLVDAMGRRAEEDAREALLLRVILADAYLQLGDRSRATELVDSVLPALFSKRLDYIARYEVAASLLKRARAWPVAARVEWAQQLLENLAVFGDTFTTRAFYQTHRILVIEQIIDAVTDLVTVKADRRRAFLEAEELAVRRRILADWRATCGP